MLDHELSTNALLLKLQNKITCPGKSRDVSSILFLKHVLFYVTSQTKKISHSKQNSISLSCRWMEIFHALIDNDVHCKNIGKLVEYFRFLPETKAGHWRSFFFNGLF